MARISKPGLDYFPLDVNFLQDRKVRRITLAPILVIGGFAFEIFAILKRF